MFTWAIPISIVSPSSSDKKKLDILKSLLYNHFGLLELQMTSSKDNLWFVLNLTFRHAGSSGTIDILFP